jgi:hypothetical protein
VAFRSISGFLRRATLLVQLARAWCAGVALLVFADVLLRHASAVTDAWRQAARPPAPA